MPVFRTDAALWYNNGIFGDLGYAVPNCGDNVDTLNSSIAYLVEVTGRNLSAIMHTADADLRTPPSINVLTKIHKLIVRARQIIAGRAVAPGTANFEAIHATPAAAAFLLFPVPYFRVRNVWMKEYCGLMLNALSEMAQHTENRLSYEISTTFGGQIGAYLQRIYVRMASELFGIASVDAQKPDFTLTDVMLKAYDPTKYFTSTELIDTGPRIDLVPTEDDLKILTDGIPASMVVNATRWPSESIVTAGNKTYTEADLEAARMRQLQAAGQSSEQAADTMANSPPTTPVSGNASFLAPPSP